MVTRESVYDDTAFYAHGPDNADVVRTAEEEEAHQWEMAHLPLLLLGILGLGALAFTFACIFCLSPVWDLI